MSKILLFSGEIKSSGGLSNEKELIKTCPKEFWQNNPWSSYIKKLFFLGGDIKNWEWRSNNQFERIRQLKYFKEFLETPGLPYQDKEAVASWMLSEMLMKIPKYIRLRP